MTRQEADYRRTVRKLAQGADFSSDVTTWPHAMICAYLEAWDEPTARKLFEEKLLEEAGYEPVHP